MAEKLYFDNIFIGEIEYNSSDFPSFSGDFKLFLDSKDKISLHILNYIDFSARQSEFYENQIDIKNYETVEDELVKEEEKYIDLINSNGWTIQENNGEITKILVPVFGEDEISWRLSIE
jgi:hypothetical protein